ncbi:hypothetical protein SCHPADRAFT_85263 [Schizopora paradoxa]|uniref:Fungal-type protein kinase domain-containing protein n=1 Tax=Schizopora paradoxa TaxID=27342 RepID=A0A0H2S510_9AGAM|nr:hypothetical protein SCHPADRAFT_85263 [Schizopora paradoxa]
MAQTTKNLKSDPYLKVPIPDVALPIPVEAMVEGLKKKGFHDGARWVGWKEKMSKKDLPTYFNRLANAVDQIIEEHKSLASSGSLAVNGDASPRQRLRWAFVAINKPYPGEPTVRKPEIVLLTCDERVSIKWSSMHAYCDSEAELNAVTLTGDFTKHIFNTQQNRRFVMNCSLKDDTIGLMYTDSSGCLVSGLYNVHEDVEDFIRIVVGLTLLEPQHLGYDTTLSIVEGTGEVIFGEGTTCKVLQKLDADFHLGSECTMCFEVEHPEKKGMTCLMSDAWVDEEKVDKEVDILRKLNALGVTNVPKVVASEIVHIGGHVDSTENFRSAVCIVGDEIRAEQAVRDEQDSASDGDGDADIAAGDEEENPGDFLLDASMPSKTNTGAEDSGNTKLHAVRNHHRILMEPFGKKLSEFRCLEEFILAVKDIISVIKQLHDNGYLNRDVSIFNIALAEQDEDAFQNAHRRLQGFLISFHHVLHLETEGPNVKTDLHPTGRLPFMVVDMLQHFLHKKAFAHNYWHDLESLFYVFCWVCTAYSGPGGERREIQDLRESHAFKWKVLGASVEDLKVAMDSKHSFTSEGRRFQRDMERDFHRYFAPIFDCVCQMRSCLFPPAFDEDGHKSSTTSMKELEGKEDAEAVRTFRKMHLKLPHEERNPEIVFEELFAVIDDAVEKLPEEHRLQNAKPLGTSLTYFSHIRLLQLFFRKQRHP